MASALAESFMRALDETERTGDVEPIVQLFSDEAELQRLARSLVEKGRRGAEQFWREYLHVFRRVHTEFGPATEQDGRTVLEWTSQGELNTGEPVSYAGVSVLESSDGQIRRFRTYYDASVFTVLSAAKA